jgi:hypothetical protein
LQDHGFREHAIALAGGVLNSHLLDRKFIAQYSCRQATGMRIGRNCEIMLKGDLRPGPYAEEIEVLVTDLGGWQYHRNVIY